MANAGTIRIQLIHSAIGFDRTQKETLRGLGLRKRHKIVELVDTPQVRGMVYKVRHLVKVLAAGEGVAKPSPWKGAIIAPGPRTDAKPEKKAKAARTAGAKKAGKGGSAPAKKKKGK